MKYIYIYLPKHSLTNEFETLIGSHVSNLRVYTRSTISNYSRNTCRCVRFRYVRIIRLCDLRRLVVFTTTTTYNTYATTKETTRRTSSNRKTSDVVVSVSDIRRKYRDFFLCLSAGWWRAAAVGIMITRRTRTSVNRHIPGLLLSLHVTRVSAKIAKTELTINNWHRLNLNTGI